MDVPDETTDFTLFDVSCCLKHKNNFIVFVNMFILKVTKDDTTLIDNTSQNVDATTFSFDDWGRFQRRGYWDTRQRNVKILQMKKLKFIISNLETLLLVLVGYTNRMYFMKYKHFMENMILRRFGCICGYKQFSQ